jgi:ATP-dependent Clp protease ATP-binding subunit ClpX
MVPQFMARFDDVVLLRDLDASVLQEILLKSVDSPFLRSKRYFDVLGIDLDIENVAAAMIAEAAAKSTRTGARALRTVFGRIVNRLEFDPWSNEGLEEGENGRKRLLITTDMVRRVVNKHGT